MLLTGHKTRAIFDRDNIINEQELLEAGDQLVAYLRHSRCDSHRLTPSNHWSEESRQITSGRGFTQQ